MANWSELFNRSMALSERADLLVRQGHPAEAFATVRENVEVCCWWSGFRSHSPPDAEPLLLELSVMLDDLGASAETLGRVQVIGDYLRGLPDNPYAGRQLRRLGVSLADLADFLGELATAARAEAQQQI